MSDKSTIIKEAQKYLAKGQIDKAIFEWEKLIKEYPDAPSFNTIGDLYLKKGDKTNAISSFHKAANLFRHEGFSLKALAIYKKILNLKPSDSEALYSLGELNEEKGLITDAIRYYLAAADILAKEGNKEKLLEVYKKIISLSPTNIPLINKVAEIYAKEGLTSEAAKQYFHLAKLFAEKEDTAKSIEYYKKVLELQPLHKEAILGINRIYELSGNINKAIEHMNEVIKLFPEDSEIIFRYAELNMITNRLSEAEESLSKIIEIEPTNIKAKKLLGNIYLKQGDKEKAWTEYLPVLDELILNEKFDKAIELLNLFKEIDPLETGKRLVSLYRQLGENDNLANELTLLGDTFKSKGMTKEALDSYKEALEIIPEDESLKAKIEELEEEIMAEYKSVSTEKTLDEAIVEADIFIRYGLHENAKNLLESYIVTNPENIELHTRLKSLYLDLNEKGKAVNECFKLYEIYKKAGDDKQCEQIIKEAREILPDDPRLAEFAPIAHHEEKETTTYKPAYEDHIEEVAEADVYIKQGLANEARAILEKLQKLFPDNNEIRQKLASLEKIPEAKDTLKYEEELKTKSPTPEGEVAEAEELHEISLDSEVMDIFNEFKKGLEKELDEEDYETHYNLGIAYKEMGLIDDAIREFQISCKNPKRSITSSSMLGICYMEKGLYPLAIEVLKNALEKMEEHNESYWAMKYELAEAYEKNGNFKAAFDLYTEVYGWDSKFRSVSDKIDNLKTKFIEPEIEEKKPKERKDRVSYL